MKGETIKTVRGALHGLMLVMDQEEKDFNNSVLHT